MSCTSHFSAVNSPYLVASQIFFFFFYTTFNFSFTLSAIVNAVVSLQDNVNVFLKACEKLGLNEAQLFHPGDLQDVSTRVTVR